MKDKLEILIVEDDIICSSEMEDLIVESDDMILIGSTNNSKKAIEAIISHRPDAVILNLELYQGTGSGFDVLKALQALEIPKRPYLLVTTSNSSPMTYEMARNLGSDFIIPKHQAGYSVTTVIDFLRMARPIIKNMQRKITIPKEVPQEEVEDETIEQQSRRTSRRIMSELNKVGISPKSVGYSYLVEAITITMRRPPQNLCSEIAKQHGKTEASVKMAMQNAINRAWKNSSIEELSSHYTAKVNVARGNPTLVEFVCFYANKLRSEY